MLIRHLTSADLAALQDFYDSLTEAVTYFFQPWPKATEAPRTAAATPSG